MAYRKISLELVVFADDADSIEAGLNSAIDRLEETHTIFGGAIEATAVEHSGTRRKSALKHTIAAGGVAVAAARLAGNTLADAYRKVI